MKYCKKCIMPETFSGISFNSEGLCNFCVGYKPYSYLGEEKLVELIGSVKKNSKYDCLVPLSGGKDSTYILYYAVKKLNLKTIAVNYDSGMQSELAFQNMNNTCNILEVPLIIKRSNNELQKKRLSSLIRLQKRTGEFIYGCGSCVSVLQAITIKYANDNHIPLILDGGSLLEHIPKSNSKNRVTSKIESLIKYRFYNLDFSKYYHFFKYHYYNRLLEKEMGVGSVPTPPFGYRKYFDSGPTKVVRFSDYIFLPDSEKVKIISRELKWQKPKKRDKRFDCMLHCLLDLESLKTYGITNNGIVYSNLIREDLMTREDALLKENYSRQNLDTEYFNLLKKMGL